MDDRLLGLPYPAMPLLEARFALICAKYAAFGIIPLPIPAFFPDVPIPIPAHSGAAGHRPGYIQQMAGSA